MSFDSRHASSSKDPPPPISSSSFQHDFPISRSELAELALMAQMDQGGSLPSPISEEDAPINSTLPTPIAPQGSLWILRSGDVNSVNSITDSRSSSPNAGANSRSRARACVSSISQSSCSSMGSADEELMSSVRVAEEE
eukprot:TRINITY_DN22905_c1_g1_i1.p1 TRINITY_DN22905_c1_g1~~TRINITY_DN22905_c1_g1_i1.p1  ORF type:complete len:139 (-),score=10.41 TRINITY_DN22905_c1_g1_i1:505-921(-)